MSNRIPFLGLSGSTALTPPVFVGGGQAGPGPVPTPWRVDASTVFYNEGGVTLRKDVAGGTKGPGSLNASALYVNGVPIDVSTGVFISDSPPVTPTQNMLWWSSALGNLFIFYNDGGGAQWVPASISFPSAASGSDGGSEIGIQYPVSTADYSHFMRSNFGANGRIIGPYYHGTQHGDSAVNGVCTLQSGTDNTPMLMNGDYVIDGEVSLAVATEVQLTSLFDLSYMKFEIFGIVNGEAGSAILDGPNKVRVRSLDKKFTVISSVVPRGGSTILGDVAVGLYHTPANSEVRYSDDQGKTWSAPHLLVDGLVTGLDRGYQTGIGMRTNNGTGFVLASVIDIASNALGTVYWQTIDNATSWVGPSTVTYNGLAHTPSGIKNTNVIHYSRWRTLSDGTFASVAGNGQNMYWLRTTDGSVMDCTYCARVDHCMPNGGSFRIDGLDDVAKTVTLLEFYKDVTTNFPPGMAIQIVDTGSANQFSRVVSSVFVAGKTVVTLTTLPASGVIDPPESRMIAAEWHITAFNSGAKQVTLDAAHGDARAFFPVNMSTTIVNGGPANGWSFVTVSAFTAGQTVLTLNALASGGIIGDGTPELPFTVLRQNYGPRQIMSIELPSTIKMQYDQRAHFNAPPYIPVPPQPPGPPDLTVQHYIGITGSPGAGVLNTDGLHKVVSVGYDAASNTTSVAVDTVFETAEIGPTTRVTDVILGEFGFDILSDTTFVAAPLSSGMLSQIPIFATQDGGITTEFLGETNTPRGSYGSLSLDFVNTPTGTKTLIGAFQRGGPYSFMFIAADTTKLFETTENFTPRYVWRTLPLIDGKRWPNSGYQTNLLYPDGTAVITYGVETSLTTAEVLAERVDLNPVLNAPDGEAPIQGPSFIVPEREGDFLRAYTGELSDGTGRYNLYMPGSAPNYLAGSLGVGATTIATALRVAKELTGNATAFGIRIDGTVQTDVTTSAYYCRTFASTLAGLSTLVSHFSASQVALGGTVLNQYAYRAESSIGDPNALAVPPGGATNNYGFYSQLAENTVSGKTNWNFYGVGTAPNHMAGTLALGSAANASSNLRVSRVMTGLSTWYGIRNDGTIQTDVISAVNYYRTVAALVAAHPGIGTVIHYNATQGALAGVPTNPVTNQYGFSSEASLIGAINNYAFRAFNTAPVGFGRTAYGFYSDINISTGTGTTWGFFANGTAPNVFVGATRHGSAVAPVNTLDITGSFGRGPPLVVAAATGTVGATNNWIAVNHTATCTLTLPNPTTSASREINIVTNAAQAVNSSAANVIGLTGGAPAAAILPAVAGSRVTLVSDGTNWRAF